MLVQVTDPKRNIFIGVQPASPVSYWNADFNPIVYKFQRIDAYIVSISNASGKIKITFNTLNVNTDAFNLLTVGSAIYYNAGGANVGIATVTAFSLGLGTITTDAPFTIPAFGGFLLFPDLLDFYLFEVKIGTFENNIFTQIADVNFKPASNGLCTIDPSKWLQGTMPNNNGYDYLSENKKDLTLSRPYRMVVSEQYKQKTDGGSSLGVGALTVPTHYANNAAKQPQQDRFGQNMGLYVPWMNPQLIFNPLLLSPTGWTIFGSTNAVVTFGLPGVSIVPAANFPWSAAIQSTNGGTPVVGKSYLIFIKIKITGTVSVLTVTLGGVTVNVGPTSGMYVATITAANTNPLTFEADGLDDTSAAEMDMLEMFLYEDLPDPYKAKFLTQFVTPYYWGDFPFELDFIYSELIAPFNIVRVEELYDSEDTLIATNRYTLAPSEAFYVNRMKIEGGYGNNIAYVVTWLEITADLAGNCYVQEGYWADGYVLCEPAENINNIQFSNVEQLIGNLIRLH